MLKERTRHNEPDALPCRDEQGNVVINMHVKDDTNFLSVFSVSEAPIISSEVAEFLEASTKELLPKEKLALHIRSACIDNEEESIYTEAIREYYSKSYRESCRELKRNNLISLVLAIIGAIILAVAVYIECRYSSVIWSELVDIAAWVFVWEAVDTKFFKTRQIKALGQRYRALASMKIEFYRV